MKKTVKMLLVCALALCIAACGPKQTAVSTAEMVETTKETTSAEAETTAEVTDAAETTTEQKEAGSYPMTLTDQAGRTVVIEKEPERLVSCYYISTSLLIALDLDERMVGIETGAEKRKLYQMAAEELLELPGVGSAKEFDLEGCAALHPDLVILPLKLKEAAATLDELGITTMLINPESGDLLLEMIDLVAAAAGKEDRAAELKGFINEQKEMLNEKLEGTEAKRVYLSSNSNMLATAGKKMYQNSMIELAGGENVAGEIDDTYWAEVDYEQILAWNPDYFILAADAKYTVEDVLNDEALAECSAVVSNHVYKVPSDAESWDSPVPGSILGSVWLANVLHPEAVTTEECNHIIEEFYEKFYGFEYRAK